MKATLNTTKPMTATQLNLAKLEQETLSFVNKLRLAAGRDPILKLKKGVANDPHGDTIAKSVAEPVAVLGDVIDVPTELATSMTKRITARGLDLTIKNNTVKMPATVRRFCNHFDKGRYPHLLAK